MGVPSTQWLRWLRRDGSGAFYGVKISLQLLRELADAVPAHCVGPMLGTALKIIEIVEQSTRRELQERVGCLMVVVVTPLQGKTDEDLRADSTLKSSLDRLSLTLAEIFRTLGDMEKDLRSTLTGLLFYQRSAEKLKACKESLAWAMEVFQVDSDIQSRLEDAQQHAQSSKERKEILKAVLELPSRVQDFISPPVELDSPSSRCSLQLPAAPEIFHGRRDLVEQSVTLLTANDQARVFICGSGGIGKTSLALTVAHHPVVIKRFGMHRYWVPCEEAPTPGSFVLTVARSLKITIPPASADPFTDLIERFQAGEVVTRLLVLDNFETTWDTAHQANVREILGTLASLEGVSILMTTRDADATVFGLSWSRPLLQPLGRLSLEASRAAYLEHHPDGGADDRLDALLLAIDCYPLAITLMASQGALGESPSSLLKRWEEEKSRLLSEGLDKQFNLEMSLAVSINSRLIRANPEALKVLGMLALLPAGTTVDMLPQVPDLRRHVSILLKVSLAFRHSDPSIVGVLSPISAYALKNHPPDAETLNLLCLVYDQLVDSYESARRGGDESNALEALAQVGPNIDSVFRHSVIHGNREKAFNSIVRYTASLKWVHPHADLLRFALDQVQSDTVSSSQHAYALYTLGELHRLLDEYSEAEDAFKMARKTFTDIEEEDGLCRCRLALAQILRLQHRYAEARQELKAMRGDMSGWQRKLMAFTLYKESSHLAARERLQTAESSFKAIATQAASGNPVTDDRYSEPRENLQAAERVLQERGDHIGAAQCKRSLGEILRAEGRYAESESMLQEALSESRATRSKVDCAHCLYELAQVAHVDGRGDEALDRIASALVAFKSIGNKLWINNCEARLEEWKMS